MVLSDLYMDVWKGNDRKVQRKPLWERMRIISATSKDVSEHFAFWPRSGVCDAGFHPINCNQKTGRFLLCFVSHCSSREGHFLWRRPAWCSLWKNIPQAGNDLRRNNKTVQISWRAASWFVDMLYWTYNDTVWIMASVSDRGWTVTCRWTSTMRRWIWARSLSIDWREKDLRLERQKARGQLFFDLASVKEKTKPVQMDVDSVSYPQMVKIVGPEMSSVLLNRRCGSLLEKGVTTISCHRLVLLTKRSELQWLNWTLKGPQPNGTLSADLLSTKDGFVITPRTSDFASAQRVQSRDSLDCAWNVLRPKWFL